MQELMLLYVRELVLLLRCGTNWFDKQNKNPNKTYYFSVVKKKKKESS